MIEIHETGSKRLDVVVRGTLDERAVEAAAAELDARLEDGTALLFDLREYDGITAHGLAKDLAETVRLVGRLAGSRRIALVSGQRWLRVGARVDGAVLPGAEVRSFEPDGVDAARAWLDEGTQNARVA